LGPAPEQPRDTLVRRERTSTPPPRPPVQRWRPDDRERFEAELARLEAKNRADAEDAVAFAARRADDAV
jgi:hypothetical protein